MTCPAVEPGTKVRLTIADTTGLLPGSAISNRVMAWFVAFDSGAVVVRFDNGTQLGLPFNGVRRLDVTGAVVGLGAAFAFGRDRWVQVATSAPLTYPPEPRLRWRRHGSHHPGPGRAPPRAYRSRPSRVVSPSTSPVSPGRRNR